MSRLRRGIGLVNRPLASTGGVFYGCLTRRNIWRRTLHEAPYGSCLASNADTDPHVRLVHLSCGAEHAARSESARPRRDIDNALFTIRERSRSRSGVPARRPFVCPVADRLADGRVRASPPRCAGRCRLRRSVGAALPQPITIRSARSSSSLAQAGPNVPAVVLIAGGSRRTPDLWNDLAAAENKGVDLQNGATLVRAASRPEEDCGVVSSKKPGARAHLHYCAAAAKGCRALAYGSARQLGTPPPCECADPRKFRRRTPMTRFH